LEANSFQKDPDKINFVQGLELLLCPSQPPLQYKIKSGTGKYLQ